MRYLGVKNDLADLVAQGDVPAWLFGTGVPDDGGGKNGDYYVGNDNKLWQKGASAWTYSGVQFGAAGALASKAAPVDADIIAIGDSTAAFEPRKSTLAALKTWLSAVRTTGDQDIFGFKSFKNRLIVDSGANQALTLNSAVTEGGIPQSFSVTVSDSGAVGRISAQCIRFVFNRIGTATVSAFDSLFVTTPLITSDAPHEMRGFTLEGPVVSAGKTLWRYVAIKIQAPTGAGTVTSRSAIEVDAGAGAVLIAAAADTTRNDMLRVGGSATVSGSLQIGVYTLATLPSPTAYVNSYCTVSDAGGGPKLCMATGGAWKIVNTTTTVS